MKEFIGVVLVTAGIVFGFYVGIWVCFIGGIIALIEAFKADPIIAMDIAISVARIWFSSLVGWFAAAIFFYPGLKFLE